MERVRPEDILILFNHPMDFDDLGALIRARVGLEDVRDFIRPFGKNEDRDNYIFRERCLTLSTVHGAKGYDAYIVFLAGVDLFKEDQVGRASFYVGATRAKLRLYISGLKSPLMTEAQLVVDRARALPS
jgi:superfamily I DNA/RNA helicase